MSRSAQLHGPACKLSGDWLRGSQGARWGGAEGICSEAAATTSVARLQRLPGLTHGLWEWWGLGGTETDMEPGWTQRQ